MDSLACHYYSSDHSFIKWVCKAKVFHASTTVWGIDFKVSPTFKKLLTVKEFHKYVSTRRELVWNTECIISMRILDIKAIKDIRDCSQK